MVKIKTASQDYLPIPVAVTKASRLKHGRTLKLMTAHGLKIRVKVAEARDKLYMTIGWKEFIQETGLKMGESRSVVFRTLSKSRLNVIIFNKEGYSRCPIPDKAAKALINNQSSSAPSFSTKSTAPRHPSSTNVEESTKLNRTKTNTSNSANTKRIVKDMCCYNKRMKLSSEVKNYVRDIAQFLDYSSKFYIVTIKNIHEVRQGGKIFHLLSIYSLEK
uniref:TF-B3 domain-containing protein n=1 Tax=Oryza barthii TaxID=65489 RepID=A0A0D3GNW5_9ORYZ